MKALRRCVVGMYTEFHIRFELRKDTPESIVQTLEYMISEREELPDAVDIDGPLSRTEGWSYFLRAAAGPFPTPSVCGYNRETREFYSVGHAKNYDNEIQLFFAWIVPHIDYYGYCGFFRREGLDNYPTLLIKTQTGDDMLVDTSPLCFDSESEPLHRSHAGGN